MPLRLAKAVALLGTASLVVLAVLFVRHLREAMPRASLLDKDRMSEAVEVLKGQSPKRRERFVRFLEETLRNDADPARRFQASAALHALAGERAFDGCVRGCDDADDRVRASCVTILGNLRDPRGQACAQRLLRDPSGEVRRSAAYALGEIGGPEALARDGGPEARIRLKQMAEAEDPDLREKAAEALRKLTDGP